MMKSKIQKALNKQVNVELNAFYSYLSMSVYFESHYMLGAAHWFKAQSNEEFNHAMKLKSNVIARGGKVILTAIDAPQTEWTSFLSVLEVAYAQELRVSALIDSLMDLAKSEDDHATEIMLQWFVTEQVEEEYVAKSNIEKFTFIKDSIEGMMVFDHELGQRK